METIGFTSSANSSSNSLQINQRRSTYRSREIRCTILSRYSQRTFQVLKTFSFNQSSISFSSSSSKDQRSIIYTILKFLLQTHMRIKDLNSILSSIATISLVNDSITHELLDLIHSLLDMETIVDYLCESNMIEGFYSLLILNHLASETKEIIFKIINFFLAAKRVSTHTKTLLKLEANHIGFGGIVSGMTLHDLNQSMVEQILQIIITSSNTISLRSFFNQISLHRYSNSCSSSQYSSNSLQCSINRCSIHHHSKSRSIHPMNKHHLSV